MPQNEATAERDFLNLVGSVRTWVENHMDQWEKFKYEWPHGTICVTIAMHDDYPDSFEKVDLQNG